MVIHYSRIFCVAIVLFFLAEICPAQQSVPDSAAAGLAEKPIAADSGLVARAVPADTSTIVTETDTTANGLQISGEPVSAKLVKKSPKAAMIRSLIIPGWGQFYNGKWFKGIIIGGTEIGLITDAIIQNQLAVRATDRLEKEFYQENRSLAIWWLGAAILYSITDAFVDAHLHDFDASPELSMSVKKVNESFEHFSYSIFAMNLAIPIRNNN